MMVFVYGIDLVSYLEHLSFTMVVNDCFLSISAL